MIRLPQQVCKVIKPQTETHIISITKMVADNDWGDYNQSTTVIFQDKPAEAPKMYNSKHYIS